MRHIYFLLVFFFLGLLAKAQSSLLFTVNQLPLLQVDAGRDTTVAKGSQIKIGGAIPASGGSGIYTYLWSPSTNLDRTDIGNPTAIVDSLITYTLSVNDGKGCIKTSQIRLQPSIVTAINPVLSS